MRERKGGAGLKKELVPDGSEGVCKEADCGVQWRLVGFLLLFRLCNALLSYSAFVPDEYWQGLEVAHRMVFGYPSEKHLHIINGCLLAILGWPCKWSRWTTFRRTIGPWLPV